MACTGNDLVDSAKCFCFSEADLDAIATYLMCQWTGTAGTEYGLLRSDGSGFITLNDGGKILVA